MKRYFVVLVALVALLGAAADAAPAKRTRHPALSPDGRVIAFSYHGDIWTVPSEGGRAARLTIHPSRNVQPIFSPDGSRIVFSSNRFGNHDLFEMSAEGGPARRLTYHSGSEFASSFTRDGRSLIFYGDAYGALDLYKMPATGGEPIRITWDPMERKYFGSVSPDNQWIVFNLNAAPGSWRRRGYEGSTRAEIWIARFTTPLSSLRKVADSPSNQFMPSFSQDGSRIYFANDQNGHVNVWSMDLQGGQKKQLTFHTQDGVRLPSYAPQGDRIAYEYDSGIWLLDLKTGQSREVPIDIVTDERRNFVSERTITSNPSEYAVSPDGKKVALIVRGDLFVVPATGGTARRLTSRASRENHVAWMGDSATLLFATDVNGRKDIHRIDIGGNNERPLVSGVADQSHAVPSPDGKMVAFHEGDQKIVVVPAEGGEPVTVIHGSFPDVTRSAVPRFNWSPDSKWLVFDQTGPRLEDTIYVAAIADGQPKAVSRPYRSTGRPGWSRNGKTIYFPATAVDSASLYAIDLGDQEKPVFEEDALDRLDQPMPSSASPSGTPEVDIDFATVFRRVRRVTAAGGVRDAVMLPNGRTFIVDTPTGIHSVPANGTNANLTMIAERASRLDLPRDGSRIYFLAEGQVHSVPATSRERRTTNFSAVVEVDLMEENRQVFGEAWWLMDRYFYHDELNGIDWRGIRAKYEALLPHVPYKEDFYDMMNEMILELRGSHLGVNGPSEYTAELSSSTAFLGVEPDWALLESQGLFRVARVVPDSPADSRWSKLNVGDYILAIDERDLSSEWTFDRLLDRKANKKVTLLVSETPNRENARKVEIKPTTQAAASQLNYDAWVEERRKLVDQVSGGRVAYLHVRGMNVPAELRFKEELVSEATGKDALLVDVRNNGGGNVAHRLLDILRKQPYVTFRPRSLGQEVLSDWFNDYLWGRPAALLINQYSASNSEMMAEGFRALGIGPIVGVPTAGAVIATGTWTFIDGGTIRTPSVGVYTAAGEDMDLKGREPDVHVPYDPEAVRLGRDPQLERAVELVLRSMASPTAAADKQPAVGAR
jgi:tricorn protease